MYSLEKNVKAKLKYCQGDTKKKKIKVAFDHVNHNITRN